jgi:hypothetical protein
MWFCFKDAFLSVVHKDCSNDELLVRARVKGHIEAIFPRAQVQRTAGADYLYRAVLTREEVGQMLTQLTMSYEAANFKSSVKDQKLQRAYAQVWHTMAQIQEVAPFRLDKVSNAKRK